MTSLSCILAVKGVHSYGLDQQVSNFSDYFFFEFQLYFCSSLFLAYINHDCRANCKVRKNEFSTGFTLSLIYIRSISL